MSKLPSQNECISVNRKLYDVKNTTYHYARKVSYLFRRFVLIMHCWRYRFFRYTRYTQPVYSYIILLSRKSTLQYVSYHFHAMDIAGFYWHIRYTKFNFFVLPLLQIKTNENISLTRYIVMTPILWHDHRTLKSHCTLES